MRSFRIIAVALIVMYVGVEAIGNIEEDIAWGSHSDIRVRMASDAAAYDERWQ